MNLGEQVLSDLVAALKELYPNIGVASHAHQANNINYKIRVDPCFKTNSNEKVNMTKKPIKMRFFS